MYISMGIILTALYVTSSLGVSYEQTHTFSQVWLCSKLRVECGWDWSVYTKLSAGFMLVKDS
jgi:hypothetical protein